MMLKPIFTLLIAIVLFSPFVAYGREMVKREVLIGVLAFHSKEETLKEWTPLAHYLDEQISSHTFKILPLTYSEFNKAAHSGILDFAFTNPEHYIYLSAKYDITRMATLIRANVGDKPLSEFGGVIIARSERKDIQNLSDLRGKKIAAVDELSLGGYLAQRVLLQKNGIDITKESTIHYTDMPHDKVVYIVGTGSSDVGFIRTGVLERMAKKGKININDFKIIHKINNFPQALSTPLYPEWPFAASKTTDRVLANQVGVALLNLPHDSTIAQSGGYYGWNIPLSYEGIRALMQELRIKPYDEVPPFSAVDAIQKYALAIVTVLGSIVVLLSFLMWRLRQMTFSLRDKSKALEEQIFIVQEAQIHLKRAANVFHNSSEGIVITDQSQIIIDVNEAFCELTGYTKDEIIGNKPSILRSYKHEQNFYFRLNEEVKNFGSWRGEIWNKKKNGDEYAELLRIDSVRDAQGNVENYIGIFSDMTESIRRQEELHHMANYDPLTNLPNRNLFMALAEQILSLAKRKNSKAVISFLDLDGFKSVNDQYGHDIGDAILKEVGIRLEKELRQSDVVSRIGGDEFVIIFSDIYQYEDVQPMFERILSVLNEPFAVNGLSIIIGVSIGATLFPDHGEEIEMLIRHADAAMYYSKANGRHQITYYDFDGIITSKN